MAKVDITTAGHTIIVEADCGLEDLAAKALELWRATRDPQQGRAYAATGFQGEHGAGPVAEVAELGIDRPVISLRTPGGAVV